MPTMEEYAKQPREAQLARLERTADELAAAVSGADDAQLSRRPDATNWAAKEVVCHLRDTEESFMTRFDAIMAMTDPKLVGVDPDRWAEERQYLRNDTAQAPSARGGMTPWSSSASSATATGRAPALTRPGGGSPWRTS